VTRSRKGEMRILTRTLWPATVGALAVLSASIGDGASTRRSAVAWMMGSWGARLAVQGLYTRAVLGTNPGREANGGSNAFPYSLALVASAIVCSAPAWLAAFNRVPELSSIELAACAIWLVGFAGETTADRQRLRFAAVPANDGLTCRAGLWRYSRHADRVFTAMVWVAFALFGVAAVLRP
jgi:steroid 5-alpha reductase family enzyme